MPGGKWLRLCDVKSAAAGWIDNHKAVNFSEYVEDEAFRWYLEHLFDTEETWNNILEQMKERFGEAIGDPFRELIHTRLKEGQPIKIYFEIKR